MPSDLTGMTAIRMDSTGSDSEAARQAVHKLSLWTSQLIATADRIARTEIVHGYTGRWEFTLELQTWRGVAVQPPDYVFVKGYLDLIMPADGQTGRGLAHGKLTFKLQNGHSGDFEGDYHTAHEVTTALCLRDGSLELTSEAFSLQKRTSVGQPLDLLADLDLRPEPWTAKWTLSPDGAPRSLTGKIHTEGTVVTFGVAQLVKS
jgi:hypothetical protein